MAPAIPSASFTRPKKRFYQVLYLQVLFAIALGVLLGWRYPNVATHEWVKPLGDGFVKLIKMVIAPIIFCTVVSGISHLQDAKKVGRIGIKALVYLPSTQDFFSARCHRGSFAAAPQVLLTGSRRVRS